MIINLLTENIKLKLFKKILSICIIILIASFLGFIVETVWIALRHGYIDNRGMHLPLLLGYGLANLTIYYLFGTPDNPHFLFIKNSSLTFQGYFITIFIFISIAEALLGYSVHYFCKLEWWNYNSIPLHIGQYTSIPTSFIFTIFICIYQEYIFSPLLTYLMQSNILQYSSAIIILMVLAIADCVNALIYMLKNNKLNTLFQISIANERATKII